MNFLALILMVVFLSLSVALYLAGILVVNRVDLAIRLDQQVEQYYHWVMKNGSPAQRQIAQAALQKRDLEQLKSLVGMESLSS